MESRKSKASAGHAQSALNSLFVNPVIIRRSILSTTCLWTKAQAFNFTSMQIVVEVVELITDCTHNCSVNGKLSPLNLLDSILKLKISGSTLLVVTRKFLLVPQNMEVVGLKRLSLLRITALTWTRIITKAN